MISLACSRDGLHLQNAIDELKCPVITENINVKTVTETFIDTANTLLSKYRIVGFKFFNKDLINKRGGSVALYVGGIMA